MRDLVTIVVEKNEAVKLRGVMVNTRNPNRRRKRSTRKEILPPRFLKPRARL